MFFSIPAMSTKAKRIQRTSRSRAVLITSRRTAPVSLTAESIDSDRSAQRELVVRAVEIEPADLADLP